jgi:hypothetical protein
MHGQAQITVEAAEGIEGEVEVGVEGEHGES